MGSTPTVKTVKAAVASAQSEVAPRIGRYRWVICALLFFATTINYVDRQVIGILARDLQIIIGWSEIDYGNIVAAFNAAYAFGLLLSGRLIDRFGTKIGYAVAIVVWSLAGIGASFARSAFGFGAARAALGLGEAANFPAAIKTVAEWFPKKERALATGIFNAGTNVGAIVAPLTVPWVAITFGWQWAFILTGALGFFWLLFWLPTYRRPEEAAQSSSPSLVWLGFGSAGFLSGGLVGFLLRPTVPMTNAKLPFETVLTRGAYLEGLNSVLVPFAQTSFNHMLAGVVVGTVVGLIVWISLRPKVFRRPEGHVQLSQAELTYIQSDPPDPPSANVPWIRLIPHRQTCAFAIGKYLTDPIWWFYLYWIPNFLRQNHGLDLSTVGPPLIAIYLIADVGSIGGGWLSSSLIKRGWTINRARKTAMLVCALSVTPIVFAAQVSNLWVAVSLIGLAAAAHQGWSANIFTTTSDMFPRRAIGSVVGIGGMAGAMGGATMAVLTGYILDRTGGNYMIIFGIAGSAYLVALAIIHLLAPRLEPVEDFDHASTGSLSLGSLLGFGFIGCILGSFGGWCVGLISRQSGQALLKYMVAGAAVGIVSGIIAGNVLSKLTRAKTT